MVMICDSYANPSLMFIITMIYCLSFSLNVKMLQTEIGKIHIIHK